MGSMSNSREPLNIGTIGKRDAADRAKARTRGPIMTAVADRPVLTVLVVLVGLATLCATAYREAPQAAGIDGLTLAAALWFALSFPLLIATLIPHSRMVRAGVIATFVLIAVLLGHSGVREQTSDIITHLAQIALLFTATLLVLGPIIRPDIALFQFPILAALAGLVGYFAFVDILRIRDGALLDAEPALAVTGFIAALQVGTLFLSRFAASFAQGCDNRTAVSAALSVTGPFAAYASLSISLLFAFALSALLPWRGDAAGFILGGSLIPIMVTILMGGSLITLGRYLDTLVHEEHHRGQSIHDWLARRVRPYVPTSTALAVSAIAGIVAAVGAIDRITQAPPALLVAGPIIGLSAGIGFLSLRAGLLLGTLVLTLWSAVDWVVSLLLPGTSPINEASALLIASGVLAPLILFWREQRNPWRKAREVTLRALAAGLAPALLSTILSCASLAIAQATGFWPDASLVAIKALIYTITGGVLSVAWMGAFGAISGREL